jgi:hypothetical protein
MAKAQYALPFFSCPCSCSSHPLASLIIQFDMAAEIPAMDSKYFLSRGAQNYAI